MAKKVTKKLKLVIPAGKANPAPPIGPALGQAGINIGEFVKQFNDATAKMMGDIIPVDISVYEDRTFSFVLKTSPATNLILKALGKENYKKIKTCHPSREGKSSSSSRSCLRSGWC